MRVIFESPLEAQIVRIIPKTWHNEISVRFDLIGCAEVTTTTTTPFEEFVVTEEPQVMCDEPMGPNNELLPADSLSVSSEKIPDLQYFGLRINSSEVWQPLTNSPNEYIRFDFTGPRQLTGLLTRGGPQGWVSKYKLLYSNDDKTWNPILDEYGDDAIFPGNFDQDTVVKNLFHKPIRAQFLKVIPKKWTGDIQMAAEPLGCFHPYPEIAVTVRPEIEEPELNCDVCPDVQKNCQCSHPQYFNGSACGPRASCPCVSSTTDAVYAVGTVFEDVAECSTCLCALGGTKQCTRKRCAPCEGGLLGSLTKTCGCICTPCPPGEVLCPSGNVCIKKKLWCDGIVDCPDDETNCEFSTIEPVLTVKTAPKLQCPPVVCPPGFKPTLKTAKLQNVSPMFHMYGGRKTPSKTISTKYYGAKGRKILPRKPLKTSHSVLKSSKQVCAEFVCEPESEVPVESCPAPGCPPGYSIVYTESNVETFGEKLCKSYECHPPPVRDDICNITGTSFNTFDGTEFKYDICNHIVARDLHADDWDVVLVKNCEPACTRSIVIRHGDQLVKMFGDLSLEYNGYKYTAEQTAQIGARNLAFAVSRMGDTLLFVSNHYGFWIMWDKLTNVKLGVTPKLMGQVDGLCGFYDKNAKNDKRKPDGRQAKTSAAFGDSWLLEEQKPEVCKIKTCPLHVQNVAYKMCQAVRERILSPCLHALEDIDGWISRCLESTCACLDSSDAEKCRCNVLEAFVVECTTARPTVDLEDWRMSLECPASCAPPFVHHDCYRRRCEPSCTNLADADACPTLPNLCFPGCYCPAGLVRKKDKCVAPKECRDCECNVLPHLEYITYDGANHTANTNCTYIMSRAANKDFEVWVTNGPCPLNPLKMCTKTITLLVNEHKVQVVRGATSEDDFQLSIDNISIAEVPFNNGWLKAERLPARHLNLLVPKIQLELRIYFPTLGASLRVPSHSYAQKLDGICGNCDRNPEDDTLNESWRKDPTEVCAEEVLKDCEPNDACVELLNADKFGQCHMLIDPQVFLSTCTHDTCGGRPEMSCSSLETYAMACRAQGLCIDYHTALCPARSCPPGAEYALCGPPCPNTCETPKGCLKGLPKEGCFCPPGLVLKNTTECVEETRCFACDEDGHFPGDSWTLNACTKCECDAVTRTVQCETQSCPAVEKLCEDGFQPVKIKKSDAECCDKFVCAPANITKCAQEPKPLNCGQDQIRKLEKRPDGCLDFVCSCIPVDDCPVLTASDEGLQVGFERIKNDSGCCPRWTEVCNLEKCPRAQICSKFYELETTEGPCCPEYKCAPPKDKCLFTTAHTAASAGGERPLTLLEQEVLAVDENQTVADGPCRSCVCSRTSSTSLSTTCSITECPKLEDNPEYVLEGVGNRGVCCPAVRKVSCIFNGTVHVPGDKWPLDLINEPCVLLECSLGTSPDGDVSLTRHELSCDTNCQPGYEYEYSSGECCGQCRQFACVIDSTIKTINETWKSADFCTEYKCAVENGTIFVQKNDINCPKPTEDARNEFVYSYESIEEQCCGKHVPVACLVDGVRREIGDTWGDPDDPCVTIQCLHSGISELSHQRTIESCSKDCRPGWRYSPSGAPDICCGECTQVSCPSNGTLYLPGDTWASPDGCTTFECVRQPDGTLTTNVNQETCPDLSDCAEDARYLDGCCTRCNLTSGALKTGCEPVAMSPDDTLGIVQQSRGMHVQCINLDAIANFTECRGQCQSGTTYNRKTLSHDSQCLCCQAVKFDAISVELVCRDGFKFRKQVAVPSECSCNTCAAATAKQFTKS